MKSTFAERKLTMTTLHLTHSIRVIGVGGAGSNAVDRMIQVGLSGVDYIAVNTDVQALRQSETQNVIRLGPRATRGQGAGSNPEVGARAANESVEDLGEACREAEMVFVTAGLGGGTGSGAAPKVAQVARNSGAVVIGVVTMPFGFEGMPRRRTAEAALAELRDEVDTLVVVYNDRLLSLVDMQHARMDIAFHVADECLRQAVEGITHLINYPGMINLDFADLRTVLRNGGLGHFSIGCGQGENAAQKAMKLALDSPLLGDGGIEGAKAVVVNFQGSSEMSLHDINQAMIPVNRLVAEDAPIFFGTILDESKGETVEVTLIAVGLDEARKKGVAPVAPAMAKPTPTLVPDFIEASPARRSNSRVAEPAGQELEIPATPKIIPMREMEPALNESRPWRTPTRRVSA
jgi:cell division protein FtsZ